MESRKEWIKIGYDIYAEKRTDCCRDPPQCKPLAKTESLKVCSKLGGEARDLCNMGVEQAHEKEPACQRRNEK